MRIYWEEVGTFAMKWQCDETWNDVSLELYDDVSCINAPKVTQAYDIGDSPFVCKKEYKDKSCSEVSLNAYVDDQCMTEYSEIRLITHECIWYGDYTYIKLSCTSDSATISYYESPVGNCTQQYLINTTSLTEGSLEGESAGCLEVKGCYELGQAKDNTTAKIIGYSVMSIVIIVVIILIIVFTLRYKHKKKMAGIASSSSADDLVSSSIQAGNSKTHSGKKVKNPYGQLSTMETTQQT